MLINPIVALIVSVGVIAAMFSLTTPRRAVIGGYIGAWLFLPQASLAVAGFPDLTKTSAASLGIILGIVIFDAGRLARFRPSWIDLPMLGLVVAPMFASLQNKLGAYDGASACLAQFVTWGVPYLVGRLYIDSLPAAYELAMGVLIGGLVYVPLCMIELRLSPQLHRWVYGYHQHEFIQTMRGDGFRPMVFMQHGLMVAMWMASATLVATWLWVSGTVKKLFGIPMSVHTIVLLGITVLCKSFGALALLGLGLAVIWTSAKTRTALIVLALVVLPATYMYLRVNKIWDGEPLPKLVESISAERADSLQYRFNAERLITDRAMERPWFGWGGWGRSRVYNDYGRPVAETDGLWIIILGTTGLFGLTSLTLMLGAPVFLFARRIKPNWWKAPAVAPLAALAMLLLLHSIDNLANAMINPTFILIAGGLGTICLARTQAILGVPMRRVVNPQYRQAMPRQQGAPRGAIRQRPAGRPMRYQS